jgi:hypothetical protein
MAERAVKIGRDRFEVFSEISKAIEWLGRVDLVHASGSIQYTPDPLTALKTLAALNARNFALLRFPMWRGPQTVVIQDSLLSHIGIGPMPPNIVDRHVRLPITYTDINDVMRMLGGYEVQLVLDSPSTGAHYDNRLVPGASILLRAKSVV